MAGEELEERIKQAVSAADKFSTLYYKYAVLSFKKRIDIPPTISFLPYTLYVL